MAVAGGSSTSTTDNESINATLTTGPGTYYIHVFGANTGSTYDLWWDDVPPVSDDPYEENDNFAAAWNFSDDPVLGMAEGIWLDAYGGWLGVQKDIDWYRIEVSAADLIAGTPADLNVLINCTFMHSAGNIDIELVNSTGAVVASSTSLNDNENIDFIVATSGTYYIRVYGSNAGNLYNLWWNDVPPPTTTTSTTTTKDDDCGCSPRQTNTPTLGNVFGTILSWLPLMLLLLLRNRQRKAAEYR